MKWNSRFAGGDHHIQSIWLLAGRKQHDQYHYNMNHAYEISLPAPDEVMDVFYVQSTGKTRLYIETLS